MSLLIASSQQDAENLAIAQMRRCVRCREVYPISEFQNPAYYCHQSEGMETPEDNEECRECIRVARELKVAA